MESSNKYRLAEQEIKSIVYHAFGQSYRSAKELADGWANMAYLIALEDGRKVVLKIAPPKDRPVMRYEKNMMKTEVEAMRLAASIPGLPVPGLYMHDSSCTLIPTEYFIMAYIEGTSFNHIKAALTPEERETIVYRLGSYSRQINAIRGGYFGSLQHGAGSHGTWPEVFGKMIADVLEDGKDMNVRFPVSYDEIEKEILRSEHLLDGVSEAALVHWDLWDGNVLIHEGEISGIIDFERAFWGDPLCEYYFGRYMAGSASSFYAGYGIHGLTETEQRRRVLYDLYLDLILVIECEYRNYANRDHLRWAIGNFKEGFSRLQAL
ncbi:phosphotransferase family protein [Paenibacillus protaetiae]|uniref:Aminoglycoside phosphotransferase family protein n=1 Tax=Paenibacillus protaetiae TaxID=2509456 RepID=A0A4P6ET79_9BACL|nr:aminoglycoside phosphotransferase family protein [Paenibacillus protaetiae]QAY65816.1 aminoglycoside phosphotransferase family protein [Paenibacillus protaetiae]